MLDKPKYVDHLEPLMQVKYHHSHHSGPRRIRMVVSSSSLILDLHPKSNFRLHPSQSVGDGIASTESFQIDELSSRTALENLVDMLTTILVCRLEIQELLAQVLHIRLQASCFRGQPLVHLAGRAENEPSIKILI